MTTVQSMKANSLKFKSPNHGELNFSLGEFQQFFKATMLEAGITKSYHVFDKDSGVDGKGIKLARYGRDSDIRFAQTPSDVPIDNFQTFVQKVIRDIGSSEDTSFALSEYFPDSFVPSYRVVVDIVDAITGVTQARQLGENFPQAAKIGNRMYEYAAPYWGEEFIITEQDIFLRALGDVNLSTNGLPERLGYWVYQAMIRQLNLKKNLICTLFNNGYKYNGQVLSYGIPDGNRFQTLGPKWATLVNGQYQPNPAAMPLFDLRNWMNSTPFFYKYRGLLRKVFMNPNTHRWFFDNPNNNNTIQFAYANAGVFNQSNQLMPGMQTAFKYFIASDLNVKVVVEAQQYIPDVNDPFGNTAGQPTYFIPDGYLLFGLDTLMYGGTLGEFCYTKAAQNGGMFAAQPGPYLAIQDNSLAGTRGGLTNPYLSIVSGFNGGLKLDRAMNIVTACVI